MLGDINIGDAVRLKSGGPHMVVSAIQGPILEVWLWRGTSLTKLTLPAVCCEYIAHRSEVGIAVGNVVCLVGTSSDEEGNMTVLDIQDRGDRGPGYKEVSVAYFYETKDGVELQVLSSVPMQILEFVEA